MNYIPKENNRNRNGLPDTSYQVLSVALSCEVSKSVKGLMKELARNKFTCQLEEHGQLLHWIQKLGYDYSI